MILEEAIVSLLLRYDCVVIPSFGGFVAQNTSATIDVRSGIMTPPRKSVLFNRQLVNNDGLLISHLSKESKLGYSAAEKLLKEKVADWVNQLKTGQRVSIDKIGHLYLDAERNISFEQDRFFNLLLQSYGLVKIHFISEEEVKITEHRHRPEKIATKTTILTKETKVDFSPKEPPSSPSLPQPAAKVIPIQEEPSRKKTWKYLAAVALLPFAFYTFWIPMKTNVLESGMISFKDFNPTYRAAEGVYQKKDLSFPLEKQKEEKSIGEIVKNLPDDLEVYSYKFSDDLYISVDLKGKTKSVRRKEPSQSKEIPEPRVEQKATPTPTKVTSSKPKTPQYIVGCYSSAANAKSFAESLRKKGFDAHVVGAQAGLSRVSVGGSINASEMDEIVKKAKIAGLTGWIMN